MRKLKRIEFRFRRKVSRVPMLDLFLLAAVSYLLVAAIHTNLDPYLEVIDGAFMEFTREGVPVSWSGYVKANDYFQ